MKKRVWGLLTMMLALVVLMSLNACSGSPKPPQEAQIRDDIPQELLVVPVYKNGETETFPLDISSISIEKRQTNEKDDTVYCVLELENELYCVTRHVRMDYTFYDEGGWMLDGCSETEDWKISKVKANPFTEDELIRMVSEYDSVQIESVEVLPEACEIDTLFTVETKAENLTTSGTVEVKRSLERTNEWTKIEYNYDELRLDWDVVGHWYADVDTGIYLDILDYSDGKMRVEAVCEDVARSVLSGANDYYGRNLQDESNWHAIVENIDVREIRDPKENTEWSYQETPRLNASFEAFGESYSFTIFKDSAKMSCRMATRDLVKVEDNPFLPLS